MELQQKNFLNLTAAYVTGEKPVIESPDWEEIYKLSFIHSLSGVVYTVVQNGSLCDNSEIMNKMTGVFMKTVGNSVNQEIGLANLINLLNLHKIKHIVFKGTVLRNFYPDKELRTMGDIDIVIEKQNKEKAHKILLEEGYLFDEAESQANVSNYTKNGVLYEIHTEIISSNLFDDVDYIGYFNDTFKHTKIIENYTYEFNNEFHLIYLIAHMAKHFKSGGCGLRMYMDIVMFLRRFKGGLDLDYIKGELKKLKLLEFTDSVFQLCNRLFKTDIPLFENEISEAEADVITEYVLAGGTFGFYDKNVDALRAANKKNGLISKIKIINCFLFPGYAHLKRRYEWMKSIPKWLLPAAWVKYWYYRIFYVKQDNINRVKQALENSDDAVKHYKLMEKIGLV